MAAGGCEENVESYTVMTLNMTGKSTGNGKNDNERKAVEKIVDYLLPDIVCAQEISAPTMTNWLLSLPECYETIGTEKEAGILLNSEKFASTQLTIKKYPDLDSRSCIVKLQNKISKKQLLVISWHGESKVEIGVKKKQRETLLKIAKEFSYQTKIPVLIGGDFNYDDGSPPEWNLTKVLEFLITTSDGLEIDEEALDTMREVAEKLQQSKKKPVLIDGDLNTVPTHGLKKHAPTENTSKSGIIDYFFASDELKIDELILVNDGYKILDHKAVVAHLQFLPSYTTGSHAKQDKRRQETPSTSGRNDAGDEHKGKGTSYVPRKLEYHSPSGTSDYQTLR